MVITPHGVYTGREGARDAWARLLDDLPNPQIDVTGLVPEGDLLSMSYTVESDKRRVTDGVDTLVFDDDGIRRQTIHYSRQAA